MKRFRRQKLTILNIETGELATVSVKTYLAATYPDTRQRFRPLLRVGYPPHRRFFLNDSKFESARAAEDAFERDRSRSDA